MMYSKKGMLFNLVSINNYGICKQEKVIVKEIICSSLQSLNKAETIKTYGIEDNITCQIFIPPQDTNILDASYIEIDNIEYHIEQIYDYQPSHFILLLKKVK